MASYSNNPSLVVRQLLIDLAIGVQHSYDPTDGSYNGQRWPAFATNEPSTPDDCLTVYDTQGTDDIRSHVDGIQEYHPGIQVRIRAVDSDVGRTKAEQVRRFMEQIYRNVVHVDANSYTVLNAAKIGNVICLGTEAGKTKRVLFTVNCTLALRQN